MAINLADITSAVRTYLNQKVTVVITEVAPEGDEKKINPGEEFEVRLETSNAVAASGGVAIRNLKYRVSVDDGSVAKLVVPGIIANRTTSVDGKNVLTAGEEHTSMLIEPILVGTALAAGESVPFSLKGKASEAANGGKTSVNVQVLADVDLDALFPQGEDTPKKSAEFKVQPD